MTIKNISQFVSIARQIKKINQHKKFIFLVWCRPLGGDELDFWLDGAFTFAKCAQAL